MAAIVLIVNNVPFDYSVCNQADPGDYSQGVPGKFQPILGYGGTLRHTAWIPNSNNAIQDIKYIEFGPGLTVDPDAKNGPNWKVWQDNGIIYVSENGQPPVPASGNASAPDDPTGDRTVVISGGHGSPFSLTFT